MSHAACTLTPPQDCSCTPPNHATPLTLCCHVCAAGASNDTQYDADAATEANHNSYTADDRQRVRRAVQEHDLLEEQAGVSGCHADSCTFLAVVRRGSA
jgi:hypothetical protein